VPVVDDHLVDPLAADRDPPTDQGSALWCLCDLHMPLGE
jgi:hypothetical protein